MWIMSSTQTVLMNDIKMSNAVKINCEQIVCDSTSQLKDHISK